MGINRKGQKQNNIQKHNETIKNAVKSSIVQTEELRNHGFKHSFYTLKYRFFSFMSTSKPLHPEAITSLILKAKNNPQTVANVVGGLLIVFGVSRMIFRTHRLKEWEDSLPEEVVDDDRGIFESSEDLKKVFEKI